MNDNEHTAEPRAAASIPTDELWRLIEMTTAAIAEKDHQIAIFAARHETKHVEALERQKADLELGIACMRLKLEGVL